MSMSTKDVLEKHIQAFGQGIDPIMEDFSEDSIIITHDATYHGMSEIRGFFSALLAGLPEGFGEAFVMRRQEVEGEVAYLLWDAKPWFPFCTDTIVVRDGKILYQTFSAQLGQ